MTAVTAQKIASAATPADAEAWRRLSSGRAAALAARETLVYLSKHRPQPRGALGRAVSGENWPTTRLQNGPGNSAAAAAGLGALALQQTVPTASRVDALEGAFAMAATAHHFGTVETYSAPRLLAGTRHLDDAIPRLMAAESREFATWRDAGMTQRPGATGPEITAEQVAYALPRSMDDVEGARARMDALVQTLQTGRVVQDEVTANVNDVFAELGL